MNIVLSKCFTSDGAVASGRNEFFPSVPEKHWLLVKKIFNLTGSLPHYKGFHTLPSPQSFC